MDLNWLGHSSFRLHSEGMVVVTDPFPESLGLRIDGRPASVVTVSNTHPNHSAFGVVGGDPKVFPRPRRVRVQRHHGARGDDPPDGRGSPTTSATWPSPSRWMASASAIWAT